MMLGDRERWLQEASQHRRRAGKRRTTSSGATPRGSGTFAPTSATPIAGGNLSPLQFTVSSLIHARIAASSFKQDVDLLDHGNPTPGTFVTPWYQTNGENQVWCLQQVDLLNIL